MTELRLRPVSAADSQLLWHWVNDADVRTASFHSEPIALETHERWFGSRLSDAHTVMFIVETESGPIGQVRFELDDEDRAFVDVSVARSHRGSGCAGDALRLACGALRAHTNVREIVAHVRVDNSRSIRAFESAGFERSRCEHVHGQPAIRLVLR